MSISDGEFRIMQPDTRQFFLPLIRGAAWASAAFSLVVGVLVLATTMQLRLHDPTTSPVLARMIERAREQPDNDELKAEIRALDYLARKAYFTSIRQIRVGGVLLIISIAATVLLWRAHRTLSPDTATRPGTEQRAWWSRQSRARSLLSYAGGAVILIAAGTAVFAPARLGDNDSAATAPPPLSADELRTGWTGFRGPGGNGVAFYDHAPVFWDGKTMEGVRWKAAVPRKGNSSPIVWDGHVFVTGGDETAREVFCFALKDGTLLWRHEVNVPAVKKDGAPTIDRETGYAAPTPACDGQRVFAIFPTGELVALDLDGKQVWAKHLGVPENHYGHASSLIVNDDMLYVQFDHAAGRLLAMKVTTGELIWDAPRQGISWASPICVNTGRRRELVLVNNETATSHDPGTGAVLWSEDCMYGEVGPSPAYAAGLVYVTAEYSPAAAVRTQHPQDADSSRILWRWDDDLPTTASPVATDSFVFFATAGGVVSCVRADSGTTVWSRDFDEGFYSSPLIVGDRVYLMDRKGTMRIFAIDDEYREIGSPALGEPSVATPAVLKNCLVLRGTRHLFCIEGTTGE